MAKLNSVERSIDNKSKRAIERHTTIDDTDNVLPSAEELEALVKLDPKIIDWIKNRADSEQRFRHDAHYKKLDIITKDEKGNRRINYYGMTLGFIIMAGGMFCSYMLVITEHAIAGTLFGGGSLILAVNTFVKKGDKK